jgi:DUF1009 family protein
LSDEQDGPRIGLVAGWGRYPIVIAEAVKRLGGEVHCLGIRGHADPKLRQLCDSYRSIGLAKLGAQIRYFRRRQVTHATMAGKIFKNRVVYRGLGILQHFPDWRGVKAAIPFFVTKTKSFQDDSFMSAYVDEWRKDGIEFGPATDFAPELLVKAGTHTKRQLTDAEWKEIEVGWRTAKELGRLDVGQSVAVKGRVALAVEAIEGTDECIRRAGELCSGGSFTVVKVAKPQQDMRYDVPAIGVGTLQTMVDAGASVLAVEAQKTIILDESEVIDFANRHKLVVAAIDESEIAERVDAA